MSDVFEEVEEQLRADRYKTLAFKALPWVLAVLVLAAVVAGGVWGWRAWQSRSYAEASKTYAEGLAAFAAGDRERAGGPAHGAAVGAQAGEGLRRRDLVDEVQVDVEDRLAVLLRNDVGVPDLVIEGLAGHGGLCRWPRPVT